VPLRTGIGGPRQVVASMNCTVPITVAGITVAVNVTVVPSATGDVGEVPTEVVVATGRMRSDSPMLTDLATVRAPTVWPVPQRQRFIGQHPHLDISPG
jgi:hypothetical protein